MQGEDLRVLIGWKEVAAYLKCSISTAARRIGDGLPVFRVGGSVRAFAADIDRWLEGERLRKTEEPVAGEPRLHGVIVEDRNLHDTLSALTRGNKGHRYAVIALGVDTSEYERVEGRLASAEEKHRWLLETVPVWIWETNAAGEYKYSNVAVVDMLGYRPEELAGFLPDDFLVVPEDAERCRREMENVRVKKKVVRDLRCRFIHRDGTWKWLETDAEPVFDAGGDFAGIRGVSRDITERKRAEEKEQRHLRELSVLSGTAMDFVEFPPEGDLFPYIAEKLKALAGGGIVALASFDEATGGFTVRSVSGLGKNGGVIRKLLGREPVGVTFPTAEKVAASLRAGKLQKLSVNLDELTGGAISRRVGRKLKQVLGFDNLYGVGFMRYGKLLGVACIFPPPGGELANRDVIEAFISQASVAVQRKAAEDGVLRAAEEWRRTFDAVPDLILFVDRDGNVVRVNRAAAEHFRKDWAEIIGQKCCRLLQDRTSPKEDCPLSELYATGEEQRREEAYVPAAEAYFDFKFSPIKDDGERVVGAVIVGRDVTGRRRAEVLTRVQRDLAQALAGPVDLEEGARLCVRAAMRAAGMDAGGMYVAAEDAGGLDLVYAEGFSPAFVARASHYEADSAKARLVHAGEPAYGLCAELGLTPVKACRREGLRAVGVVPIKSEGEVVACLNVASHTFDRIEPWARDALEGIAAQVGSVIARLRAEEALRESRRNFQNLFNTIEDFVFVLDGEGRIVHANAVVRERLGYSEEELAGMVAADVHPPERREEAEAVVAGILSGKRSACDLPLAANGGAEIPVETRVTRGRWGAENVSFLISRDVTERVRTEETRERERQAFRIIAEAAVKGKGVRAMCRRVVAGLAEALGFELGTVRLYDEEAGTLDKSAVCGANRDEADAYFPVQRVDDRKYIASHVARQRRAIFAPDVKKHDIAKTHKSRIKELGLASLIAWPIVGAGGRLLGVMQLGSRTPKDIPEENRAFFEAVAGMFATVLERRRAEESLRKSEAKHRLLLESIGSPVLALTPDMKILYCNAAYAEFVGRPSGELEGKKLLELFPGFAATRSFEAYVRAFETGTPQEAEGKHGEAYLRTTVFPMPWGILAVAADITERRRAEEALRESEEKFRNLAEESPNMIFINEGGKVVYANKKCEDALGYAREQFYGRDFDFLSLVAPAYREAVERNFAAHIRGEDMPPLEYSLLTKSGETIEAILTTKLIAYEGASAVLGIVTDITVRKRTEESLRANEARFRTAIDSLPFDFFVLDESGRYVISNSACRENWGDIIGKRPEEIAADRETAELWLANNRRAFAGEVVREDVGFEVKGEKRHYHNVISPVYDGDAMCGILGVNIDITERKRAEDRTREAMREKEAILSSMVERIVCHDGDMKILWANAAAAASAGLAPGEIVGRYCFEVWHGLDEACPGCPVAKAFATGERHEAEMTTPEGRVCYVRGYPVRDAAGNVKNAFEVTLDITERKRAEEALRDSEERYRGLFEKSPISITLVDRAGAVVDLNRATEDLIGYSRGELLGKRLEEIPALEPGDVPRLKENLAKLVQGAEVEPCELEIMPKRGRKRRIEVANCPWACDGEIVGVQVIAVAAARRRGAE